MSPAITRPATGSSSGKPQIPPEGSQAQADGCAPVPAQMWPAACALLEGAPNTPPSATADDSASARWFHAFATTDADRARFPALMVMLNSHHLTATLRRKRE